MLGLLLSILACAAEERPDVNLLFKRAAPSILTVRVGLDESSSRHSYGTGFPLDQSGIVVTNFHVIDAAVFNPSAYRIFVERDGVVAKASVLRIDPVNDLALLDTSFKSDYVPELSDESLTKGDKIYSMSAPRDLGVGISEGFFSGEIIFGPYRNLVLSLPQNNGVVGGPIFGPTGKVVGVSVASPTNSQNMGFAVPASLINRLRKAPPSLEISPHIRSAQDSMLWLMKNGNEKIALSEFKVLAPPKGLNCWRDKKEVEKLKRLDIQSCTSRFRFHGDGVPLGYLEMWHVELDNKESEEAAAYRKMDYAFNREFSFISDYKKDTVKPRAYTEHDCVDANVLNAAGIPLKASVCLAAIKKYESFYDGLVRVMTINPSAKRPVLLAMRLVGFSKEAIKEVASKLIESVEK